MGCNKLTFPNASMKLFSGESAADSKKPSMSCSCHNKRIHPLQLHLLLRFYTNPQGGTDALNTLMPAILYSAIFYVAIPFLMIYPW